MKMPSGGGPAAGRLARVLLLGGERMDASCRARATLQGLALHTRAIQRLAGAPAMRWQAECRRPLLAALSVPATVLVSCVQAQQCTDSQIAFSTWRVAIGELPLGWSAGCRRPVTSLAVVWLPG
jgi:hypothetical protein